MSNLAFTTLVIYALLLPGLLFQKGYAEGGLWFVRLFRLDRIFQKFTGRDVKAGRLSGDHPTHPRSTRGFAEELIKSFVAAIILHAIWIPVFSFFYERIANTPLDLGAIALLAFGIIPKDTTYSNALQDFGRPSISYLITIWIASWNLGRISLSLVRGCRLDHRTRMFRFKDPWFYRLRGEILCFKEFSDQPVSPKQLISVNAKVVVKSAMGSLIYSGIIVDFTCSSPTDLRELVLSEAECSLVGSDLVEKKAKKLSARDLVILDADKIEAIILSPLSIGRDEAEAILREAAEGNGGSSDLIGADAAG